MEASRLRMPQTVSLDSLRLPFGWLKELSALMT